MNSSPLNVPNRIHSFFVTSQIYLSYYQSWILSRIIALIILNVVILFFVYTKCKVKFKKNYILINFNRFFNILTNATYYETNPASQ